MLTTERGRRNWLILNHHQYAPVSVEELVVFTPASTRGFLDKVPVNNVKQFEKSFL
jgi:F-type H+-transporting ATPase subunit alpha